MPTGPKLRNRLTFWSFLLISLLLSVGGFFCYYDQQQELLQNLDQRLLSIARNFACNYREVQTPDSAQKNFCQDFNRIAINQAGEYAATLYSPQGTPLCSNRHPYRQLLELTADAETNSSAGRAYYETVGSQERLRRLTFPVIDNDEARYHLQVGHSLDRLKRELSRYRTILLLGGVAISIVLTFCQWLLLGTLFAPIRKLAQQMAQANEDNLDSPYQAPAPSGPELRQLSESYNAFCVRMREVLQRSRQFAADVTHELRTPLTILRGETELALRGDKNTEELKQILNSNLEEISRMGHLVDDLLLLSKSEMGEIPLKMEALNLNEMLEELHFHGAIIAEPKQIKVELLAPEQQVSIFADANRIRQVFLNLLTNGIKYTPEGGTVTIDWSLQGEMARIIFKDTGIGIDSEHQQNIFDRFYRIDKTRNRNDGGSGLGLAIAKWLVEAHGGSIMVCSAPGQGSSFAILLPLTHMPDKKQNTSDKA